MRSAYFKIVFAILLVSFAMIAFNIYASVYAIRQTQRQAAKEKTQVLSMYLYQLDNNLSLATVRCANQFADDADYLRLANPVLGESSDEIALCKSEIKNELKDLMNTFSVLSGSFVYFPQRDVLICSRRELSSLMAIRLGKLDEGGLETFLPKEWSIVELDGTKYLASLRAYRNGYYGMWVTLDELMNSWGLNLDQTDQYGIMSAEEVFSDGTEFHTILEQQSSNGFCSVGDKNYIALRSGNGCYYMYSVTTRSYALQSSVLLFVWVGMALAILAGPLLYRYMRRVIVRPVNTLLEGMRQVEGGNTDYRIPEERSSYEFERLNRHFNHMLNQIQKLKLDMYQGELQRSQIKMRYLSQQIQPHFILNTLNLIYSYEPEEHDLIQRLILCLARYYRYIISTNENFVPLTGELEHIRNYFDIQKARYPGFFSAEIANKMPTSITIPPLIIQPFAENFIKHAIDGEQTMGIYILAEPKDDDTFRLRVWDTSNGYPPEVLEEIHDFQADGRTGAHLGIGIRNVIERLGLLYAGKAVIRFANRPEGGAMVDMELPQKSEVREEWKS